MTYLRVLIFLFSLFLRNNNVLNLTQTIFNYPKVSETKKKKQ